MKLREETRRAKTDRFPRVSINRALCVHTFTPCQLPRGFYAHSERDAASPLVAMDLHGTTRYVLHRNAEGTFLIIVMARKKRIQPRAHGDGPRWQYLAAGSSPG